MLKIKTTKILHQGEFMAFYNYILLTVLFILIGFLVVSAKRKLIKKIWLKRTVTVITSIAIVFITLEVVLLPNLKGIPTTGEYSYTSRVLELTDASRIEEYKTDGSPRKLSVLVYYPTDDGIVNNSCPLVVFSHGGISMKTSNLSLYKELASHGYVVVSIDHTYHALYTEIDGMKIHIDFGYMRELNEEDSHSDIENSYACFQKWMKLRTDDINFVIDTFIEKSMNKSNSFYRLTDTKKIGVAGHSLGGSAALGVAKQRNDIKAVIALESPYMCDITGVDGNEFKWNTEPYRCAVMNIYSDSGYPLIGTDNKYVQNKNHLHNNGNIRYYYIEGSNHYTLTDLVRTSPFFCALLGGSYKKSGYDTLKFINQKSLTFFDEYLK
jgi:dienelactone hydrolase